MENDYLDVQNEIRRMHNESEIYTDVYDFAMDVVNKLIERKFYCPRIFNHGNKSVVLQWSAGFNNAYLTISKDNISALISSPKDVLYRYEYSKNAPDANLLEYIDETIKEITILKEEKDDYKEEKFDHKYYVKPYPAKSDVYVDVKVPVTIKRDVFEINYGYKDSSHCQVRLEPNGNVFVSHSSGPVSDLEVCEVPIRLFDEEFRKFVLHLRKITKKEKCKKWI